MKKGVFVGMITVSFFIPLHGGYAALFRNLSLGDVGNDVRELQVILNADPDTRVASVGVGSPGQETDYFGSFTKSAVIRFQEKYRSEVLSPVGLSYGSGFVGAMTRAKLSTIKDDSIQARIAPVPSIPVTYNDNSYTDTTPLATSSVIVPPRPYSPKPPTISRVSPPRVRIGDTVSVYGDGFTPTGNTITLATGALSSTYTNLQSADGKSVTFTYRGPEQEPMTVDEIKALPQDAVNQIEKPIKEAGTTLEDVVQGYKGVRNETELATALGRNGKKIEDLDEIFHITISNTYGGTENPNILLRAERKFNLHPPLSAEVKKLFSPVAEALSPFPKKAVAQVGGGGLNASIVMYCTCGGGHLSYLVPFGGIGGLTYFYIGFVGVSGTSFPGGLYLGLFTPAAGQCLIYAGYGCFTIPGNLPWPAQYGQTT